MEAEKSIKIRSLKMNLLFDIASALLPEMFLAILIIVCLILTFSLKDDDQNLN